MFKYGNVTINPAGLEGVTKAEFEKQMQIAGLSVDKSVVWKQVLEWRKANKKKKK